MTIEELKQLRVLANEIKSKYEVLQEAKANVFRITRIISDMPKTNNVASDPMLKAIIISEEMQETLLEMVKVFNEAYEQATKEISQVENVQERMVLEYRYLAYKSWFEIASLMHFSKRRVLQLHKQAIKHFT